MSSTIVPAAQDSAVLGGVWIPMKPVMLFVLFGWEVSQVVIIRFFYILKYEDR